MQDGLSQLFVKSIHQDDLGRMWFCTNHGIDIYDGNEVKTLEALNQLFRDSTSVFEGNSTGRIIKDKAGNMFFFVDSRLVKYDIVKDEAKLCSPNKLSAHNVHDGVIYVWQDNILFSWDDENSELVKIREISNQKVNHFIIEDSGKMWLGCENGLFSLETDSQHPELIIPMRTITCLIKSSNGEIWTGTYIRGLYRVLTNGKVIHYNKENSSIIGFGDDQIRSIVEDYSGHIWFGTFNGLYQYNSKTNHFTAFQRDFKQGGLSNSSVHSLFLDKLGVLWVGTYFGGVNYFNTNANQMSYYTDNPILDDCLTHPVVGEMVEDRDGKIWICTEGGGLNCLDPKSGKIRHFTSKTDPYYLPNTNLKSIVYEEKSHKLYIAAYPVGVFVYDIAKDHFEHIISDETAKVKGTPHPMIYKLAIYHDELYIASDDGMYKMNLESRSITSILPDTYIASFVIDKENNLWTVERRQIRRISLDNFDEKKIYKLDHPQETIYMTSLFVDKENKIYAGTFGSGIFILEHQKQEFVPFPSNKSPLINGYCYKINENRNGHLLVISDKGLIILDKSGTIIKTYSSNIPPLSPFVNDCGMMVSNEGRIYIGGTNGLTTFIETEDINETVVSNIFFSGLFLQNEQIRPNSKQHIIDYSLPFVKEFSLKHSQNNFRLTFASDIFEHIYQPDMYEYKLNGFDKEWITASSTSISYTNLSPGSYQLVLRLKPEFQSKNLKINEAYLTVNVLKPWYDTWWARAIWLLLVLTVSYIAFNIIRTRQNLNRSLELERLEKKHINDANEAKFRFFTNISHEFRTPLTLIISQIELLLQNTNLSPLVYNKLLKVSQQSQRMNRLITELLDFRKYEQKHASLKIETCSLNYFIKEIGNSFQDFALKKNITYSIQTLDEDISVWIDREQMQKVFMNLLSNAFKFTKENGTIEISIQNDSVDYISVLVVDSGVGIDPNETEKIFGRFYQSTHNVSMDGGTGIGLALSKSIIDMHQGSIDVKSQLGYGSIFKVTIKKGFEHFEGRDGIIYATSQKDVISDKEQYLLDTEEENLIEEDFDIDNKQEKCLILIVEDNPDLLSTLKNLFQPLYNVETAMNGEEGLEKAKKLKPDIIISDVMMPVMTGTEMCQIIKKNIELSHIPVILLTALNLPEHNMNGLRIGADDYIVKPFNGKLLLARCNNLIRSRKLLMQKFASKQEMEVEMLATTPVDKIFLEKVVKIIDEHITDVNFGVNELATELIMSRSGLFLKFKSLTGMTPNDFIRGQRLKHAAELLKTNKDITVTEVADMFTFCTAGYFGRCFKEQFGVTPLEYRNM